MVTLDAVVITIIVSLIAGGLASLLMAQRNSLLGNILLGFCGTIVGDIVDNAFNIRRNGIVPEIIIATICAIALIWVWRSLMARPRRRY